VLGWINPTGALMLFTITIIDSCRTSQTNVVSGAERLCPSLCAAMNAIPLRFDFSPLSVIAVLASERITCALLFVFVESVSL
jgi:hypothetical protein